MVDSPTGLVYLFARYYDPNIGRFYAPDPRLGHLSAPQTLNRYVYCVNNPMTFTDPTGMDVFGDIGGWLDDNWQTVVIVAACVVVTAVTAGLAAPLTTTIAVGAIVGAGTNVAIYAVQNQNSMTLEGATVAAVTGAITGAVGAATGGIASGGIKLGGVVGGRIAGSVIGRLGTSAALGSMGGISSYLAGEGVKMAWAGGQTGKITTGGLLFGAGTGAITGAGVFGLSKLGTKFPTLAKPNIMDSDKIYGMRPAQVAIGAAPSSSFTATMSVFKAWGIKQNWNGGPTIY